LVKHGYIRGKVLDYGCGKGKDCDTYGWDGYDPNTPRREHSEAPRVQYDTIVCTYVLNVVPEDIQEQVLATVRDLLTTEGRAYVSVRRDIPAHVVGVSQWVVRLAEPSIRCVAGYEIYEIRKHHET
jgi:2-polyprenyl-3-methyl-5-hydroxy-6-metoxy-1,4-benzoquinol methylase